MLSSTVATALLLLASSAIASPVRRQDSGITQSLFDDLTSHVKLAGAAYCDLSSGFTCQYCADFPNFVVATTFDTSTYDTVGYVGTSPDTNEIIVGFRGSQSAENWYEDGKFDQQAYVPTVGTCDGCNVHIGFDESWKDASAQVLQTVASLQQSNPSYGVSVVGHSLGGAVAALAAYDLYQTGANVRLYTYGQPRTGDSTFAAAMDSVFGAQDGNALRTVHFDDPIPRVPGEFIDDYHHHATQYWESINGTVTPASVLDCMGDEDPNCSLSTDFTNFDTAAHSIYMNLVVDNC